MIGGGISAFILARDAVHRQRYERMQLRQRVKKRVIQEVQEQAAAQK